MHPYFSSSRNQSALPPGEVLRAGIEDAVRWVKQNLGDNKDIGGVQFFHPTSPEHVNGFKGRNYPQPSWYTNPQTVAFCNMLGIENKINPPPPNDSAKPPSGEGPKVAGDVE